MLAVAVMLVIASASYLFVAVQRLEDDADAIAREQQSFVLVNQILSSAKDAETGKRGFILTGDETYLEPYFTSRRSLDSLLLLLPGQYQSGNKELYNSLRSLIAQKLSLTDSTIRVRREGGLLLAQTIVASKKGKQIMDSIRLICKNLQDIERQKVNLAFARNESSFLNSKLILLIAAPIVLLFFIGFAVTANRLLQSRELGNQTLLEQKKFTESILGTVPSLMLVFDVQLGSFTFVNTYFERLLGYTSEEMTALGENALWSMVHPDDIPNLRARSVKLRSATENVVYELEYRIRHKDGTWRYLTDRAVIFQRDENGAVRQIHALKCCFRVFLIHHRTPLLLLRQCGMNGKK